MTENPNNKKMTLRVPKPLHAKIQEQCQKERIAFNKKVLALLKREFGQKDQEEDWLL
jgi:predicted HicB family RNase H-like nuclease